jgi:prepilin-type N-terminal cleavage/methylation domain-containing protein
MHAVRGFTLLELIIVLIISTLLITIAIPGFQTLIQSNRLTSVGSSIQNNLLFARSQSVSYLNYVTVCPLESNVSVFPHLL